MLNPTQTNSHISIVGVVDMLWSVVDVAAKDYLSSDMARRADAIRYFRSQQFQRHIKVLGLPADWLPEGVYAEEMPAFPHPIQLTRTKSLLWA
jgi:hypothetical protein